MTRQKPAQNTQPDRPPTISIYQNAEHVGGILQQLTGQPLAQSESLEHGHDDTRSRVRARKGRLGGSLKGRLPFTASASVSSDLEITGTNDLRTADSARLTRDFTYSQAHYLYDVKRRLEEEGRLQAVDSSTAAQNLATGDFVEFQATFRPNSLQSLMDILSPDVAAELVRYRAKAAGIRTFPAVATFDEQRMRAEQIEFKAEARASLARVSVEALQIDFRSDPTSEFYGTIADGSVTAITICDNAHFVVEDIDRILDGSFTVLGKVTSPIENDVPILSRNKLLSRLRPELVDALLDWLRTSAADSGDGFGMEIGLAHDLQIDEMLDLAFPSRIRGDSFRVIPIAIYA